MAKYLVAPVSCDDEYFDGPTFIVVPMTLEYVRVLLDRCQAVKDARGLFAGEFLDYSGWLIDWPSDGELPQSWMEKIDADGDWFIVEGDVDETLERLEVAKDVAVVRIYPCDARPTVHYSGYIKHTSVEYSTESILLEDVLRELEQPA